MNNIWLNRTVNRLKKVLLLNDKQLFVIIICLAISTGFWFLNALGKFYTVEIRVPVKYVNLPDNKTLANVLPNEFALKIRAHGFTILRKKASYFFSPFEFNVNDMTNNRMLESKKSNYEFPTRIFYNEISNRMSYDFEILGMSPDTLYFRYGEMVSKKVKVKPNVKIDLKKQFEISGEIKSVPDSVIINGPQSVIDTIMKIETEKRQFIAVDKSIQEVIKIKKSQNLFFVPSEIQVNIPVEEFTEANLTVPIFLSNNAENKTIKLFPSKVKVTFLVSLSRFSVIKPEDFKLSVNYNDIAKGQQRLKINIDSTPSFIYALKINPEELEYLIEN